MASFVISISSDSSEESVGTSTTRVILSGTLPTTIPSTVPTVDSPTIPPIAPTIQYTSPFVCTDSSDSDTSERPPSQDPYEVIVARWRSRVATRSSPLSPPIRQILPAPPGLPRRPAILVLPWQPIPVVRPYRTQPNGVLKMLTARKSVGPLPTHRLALRYSADYSSSDHFTSDDSSRDSPSDSLSETSSDSHSDTSSDSPSRHSSSGHSISDSPCDSPNATSVGPSRKRRRSPTTSVPVVSPVPGALSPIHADLLSPCKRIKDSDFVTDFEVSSEEGFVPHVPREIGLGVDVEDSYEPYTEPDIDPDVKADIDACIAFADDISARGTDARVEVGAAAEEEAESSARATIRIGVDRVTHSVVADDTAEPVKEDHPDLVSADGSLKVMQRGLDVVMQELYDHMVEIPVHRVRVIESVQRDQGHRIVATSQQSAAMSEMISTLERDNMRLRGMLGVERQRVDRLRRSMSYVQRDLRQIPRRNVEANGNNGNGNGNGNGNPNVNNGVGVDAAYAMTWKALMKLMTEVYCHRNEIQRMDTELWNMTVKGNDLTSYNQRFQELTLLCTKMVPEEEDQVEKYIGGLPDNIQGNVIATKPTRLQDAVRIANNMMDQKLKGYAIKNAENKRRFDNNSRDNRGQQQPFKRQNVNGQNVARAYTVKNNIERKA
ncbi:putative reverse transcriptase domain-containing protein [Tanacetum coccineum]